MRIESIYEGAALAVEQLRTNKFRSGLTILGIVVGVATVMAMSAMIAGIQTTVTDMMEKVGPKNFMVARFDYNDVQIVTSGRPPWADNPALTVAEIRAMGDLPAVKTALASLDLGREISYGSQRLSSVSISATDVSWPDYTAGEIVAGHNMLPHDVRASAPVAVLSEPLAQELFGTLGAIGRTVRIGARPFEVIGVFRQVDNIFAGLNKNFVVMPYTSALKHLKAGTRGMNALVVTAETATQDEAMDQVIALLRASRRLHPGDANDFAVIRQEELLDTFNRVTGVFFMVMLALSSVGLMVGGVGVIAIMMIAVTERTREIGIRKAMGATRREILWQFLVESTTLTFIGAAIGMALGGGSAFLVAAFTPIPAAVPLGAVVAALGMAAVAGILFGMWPAWRAARLDPVDALRYE
ncbi:MAG: ABC transporter permease [Gemmatimonadota bacterium]